MYEYSTKKTQLDDYFIFSVGVKKIILIFVKQSNTEFQRKICSPIMRE